MLPDPDADLMLAVMRSVQRARTLSEALYTITEGLRDVYDVWRTHLVLFESDGTARVAGGYALGEPMEDAGTAVSMDLTPAVHDAVAELLEGHPVLLPADESFGLLATAMRADGIVRSLVIPVRGEDEQVVGVLSLSMVSPVELSPRELDLFGIFGLSVGSRLLQLPA